MIHIRHALCIRWMFCLCALLGTLPGALCVSAGGFASSWAARYREWRLTPHTDPAFAVVDSSRLMLVPYVSSSFSTYSFNTDEESELPRYSILSNPLTKVGATLSLYGLTLGYSTNVGSIAGQRDQNLESDFAIQGCVVGFEVVYSQNNHYRLIDADGHVLVRKLRDFCTSDLHANAYYVIDHRRFCYPAALTHDYRQVQSCGSFIAGVQCDDRRLDFESAELPTLTMGADTLHGHIDMRCRSVDLSFGYGYNRVLRHSLLHVSLIPACPVWSRTTLLADDGSHTLRHNLWNMNVLGRFCWLRYTSRHRFGFNSQIRWSRLGNKSLDLTDFSVQLSAFVILRL